LFGRTLGRSAGGGSDDFFKDRLGYFGDRFGLVSGKAILTKPATMAAETSGPIAIPAMQISGINTKVATPANIPTPMIVLELNAIAYPHETRFPSI
jgi:hypothetical protein